MRNILQDAVNSCKNSGTLCRATFSVECSA